MSGRDIEQRMLKALFEIVTDMAELLEENCRLDHHGECQAHGWLGSDKPCPVMRWTMIKALAGDEI